LDERGMVMSRIVGGCGIGDRRLDVVVREQERGGDVVLRSEDLGIRSRTDSGCGRIGVGEEDCWGSGRNSLGERVGGVL